MIFFLCFTAFIAAQDPASPAQSPGTSPTTTNTTPVKTSLFSTLQQNNAQGITGLIAPIQDTTLDYRNDVSGTSAPASSTGEPGSSGTTASGDNMSGGTSYLHGSSPTDGLWTSGSSTLITQSSGPGSGTSAAKSTTSATSDNKSDASHDTQPLFWLTITSLAALTFTFFLL